MIFQLQNLNRNTLHMLPECCHECGWWQGCDSGWPSADAAVSWGKTAEDSFGRWGKLALGDNRLLGMVQFGPGNLFARSRKLACGPVDDDSILLACSLVADAAMEPVRKSLVLAVVAELQQEGVDTVEAFCRKTPDPPDDCRLFGQDFLKSCGFYPARSSRGLSLMRLELSGAQPVEELPRKARLRILERIKRPSPNPTPAMLSSARRRRRAETPASETRIPAPL